MELLKDILCTILQNENVEVTFPKVPSVEKIFEMRCYQALEKIRQILMDEDLEDEECFKRIEEIVNVFEGLGSNCGGRHDF